MKNFSFGESGRMTLKNATFDGFVLNFMLTEQAGQTCNADDLDLSEVTVKGTLVRNKKEFVLFNENLLDMVRCHASEHRAIDFLTSNPITINDDQKMKSLIMPIGGIINLKGNDEFYFDFEAPFETVLDEVAINKLASYISISESEALGYEYGTPYTRSHVCPNGVGEFEKHLGSNITKIVYLDKSIANRGLIVKTTDKTLSKVNLKSDKLTFNDNTLNVVARNSQKTWNTDQFYKGDLVIFSDDDTMLNDVNLSLDLVSAKISGANQKVIFAYKYIDTRILAKAAAQENLHAIENAERAGVTLSTQMKDTKEGLQKVKEMTKPERKEV